MDPRSGRDLYQSPEVKRLGTFRELTKQGSAPNADLPQGNNNTAFPAS